MLTFVSVIAEVTTARTADNPESRTTRRRRARSTNMAKLRQRPASPQERHECERRQRDRPQAAVPDLVVCDELRPGLSVDVVAEEKLERHRQHHQRGARPHK